MTSFRGTSGTADTQPEKENKDARHESKSAQHTENLTRGNFLKRQHSRSVIEQREKSTKPVFESREAIQIGDSVFQCLPQPLRGSLLPKPTGRILVFAPSFQTIILRTLIDQKTKKESPLSRGFFFCFFYTLCAVFTIVPAKGMLVVSPHPRLPIIALVSLCVFFPSPHAFSRHPSLLCCIHPSRASTAYRPQRPDPFVGPSLYPHIHSCRRRRRCLYLHSTLSPLPILSN